VLLPPLRRPAGELQDDDLGVVYGGADALVLQSELPLVRTDVCGCGTTAMLGAGDQVFFALTYQLPHQLYVHRLSRDEVAARIDRTVGFWRDWSARCTYQGSYREQVLRSALVLKGLTNAPTGAIVAAPTTSLPEEVGGPRNWDYRFSWLRDAAMNLYALFALGYTDEAHAFMGWLERTTSTPPGSTTATAGPSPRPSGSCWPAPSRRSPVAGPSPTTGSGRCAVAPATSSPPRSWPGSRSTAPSVWPASTACPPTWTAGPPCGAFTQAFGGPAVDAANLLLPLVRFLPADDPRIRATVERAARELAPHGLVHRYLGADDGLPGGEASFVICSFWLVDNLALAGQTDRATALFERLLGHANDVGLLAEEIDPASGNLLGNFPQAFSHVGLISAAINLERGFRAPGPRALAGSG